MLKTERTRQTVGNFFVVEDGVETLVKVTVISTDHLAVSTMTENMINAELYNKHRRQMRQDEQQLRDIRYAIEDATLAELEAATEESE